jgi:hypothetical protein
VPTEFTASTTYPAATFRPRKYRSQPRDPWLNYARIFTAEGGIMVIYRELRLGWLITTLRVVTFIVCSGIEVWLLRKLASSPRVFLIWLVALLAINLLIVTRKIKRTRSVEIRHDRMIIDERKTFGFHHIGPNWPQLVPKANDPQQMVLAGPYGVRYVEYMTVNRIDDNDRMVYKRRRDALAALVERAAMRRRTKLQFRHSHPAQNRLQ